MNLQTDVGLTAGYKNRAQIARVATEAWCGREMYCVACDHGSLSRSAANTPGHDFTCPSCHAAFQLKASAKPFRRKIVDGAYESMCKALRSMNAPHFLLLHYDISLLVSDLFVVPSFFITEHSIEKRTPLPPSARRAGWVGCNIRLDHLPEEAKIPIVIASKAVPSSRVRTEFAAFDRLGDKTLAERGWTVEVLRLVDGLGDTFRLDEVYQHEDRLRAIFPNNRHVREKLRQQLQVLRDMGKLKFLKPGMYQRL